MASKRSLYVRVKVQELFPPNDPVAPYVLRLMAAVNELRTLKMVYLHASSREGDTQSEREIIKAEGIYLFRLTCATLYEAAKAFQEFGKALAKAGKLSAIERTGGEVRKAFHTLDNAFNEGFEESPWGRVLVRVRNSAFHYEAPRVFRTELDRHGELGDFIIAEIMGVSRYLLADNLQSQITARPLGVDFENTFKALTQTVAALMGDLDMLVDGWLNLQLELHEGAIVDKREDTVEIDRLWRIPVDKP